MSLVLLRRCLIKACKFHDNPVYADKLQIKNHLRFDHDYIEKQQAAFDLGLIDDLTEKHSPEWLVDSLADCSIIGEEVF